MQQSAEPPVGRTARQPVPASELWRRALRAGDEGEPAVAVRLCQRALLRQSATGEPGVRAQILVTLACFRSELGDGAAALALLDEALAVDASSLPAVLAARGMILLRSGRSEAMAVLDAAVEALTTAGGSTGHVAAGPSDLASALLNRGVLHMVRGNLPAASADTDAAARVAAAAARPRVVHMARHNLGYVRFLSGDLPGALRSMADASDMLTGPLPGVPALDRAKVLLAAGLLTEADEFTDDAIRAFQTNRARSDLAEALLVKAEIAGQQGDARMARTAAGKAARIYAGRGNASALLMARLLELRADWLRRRFAARTGTARTGTPGSGAAGSGARPSAARASAARASAARAGAARADAARADAARAEALSVELAAAGLIDQARSAQLFAAEALADAGELEAATDALRRAGRYARSAPLASRLQARLVTGRVELAAGHRTAGLAQIRRGLDELADFQARFGSQDLQSAAAIHGRELARLGLRSATETGSPAAILQWLERARAVTTRLPIIRPPADPVLAEDLGALRMAGEQATAALLAGKRDPVAERRVAELRRRVRSRSWTVSGSGRADRPPTLAAVRRVLADRRPDAGVVALFVVRGDIHALVITPTRSAHLVLAERAAVESYRHRLQGDLDLLADERIPARLATVAARSMASALDRLSEAFEPVLEVLGPGPALVAAIGPLATVPWLLLPCLGGRPVTVSSSVTRAIAGLAGPVQHAAERGVLVVAGPDVTNADKEASAIAALHPGSTLLTAGQATGGAVLDAIPSGGLVHIAAHGHHEEGNPLFSGVKLADGLVFGYDFALNPQLPGHVVLSSCDVGRTDERPGGEPLGLVAALVRSGVPTAVTGTSKVADSVAEITMIGYHERLLAGTAPAEALAAAVATATEATGLPAPFSCFGAGLYERTEET